MQKDAISLITVNSLAGRWNKYICRLLIMLWIAQLVMPMEMANPAAGQQMLEDRRQETEDREGLQRPPGAGRRRCVLAVAGVYAV